MTARPATAATLGAQFRAFLRAELATTPGRARAALRVLVASLVGTAIVMATHLPHGHWIIITIFTVSPEDAGASLAKGMQRLVGTLLGAIAGILITIAFANDPWFMFVSIGVAVAVGMYLSRTTSAPYASLLGTVTLLLGGLLPPRLPGSRARHGTLADSHDAARRRARHWSSSPPVAAMGFLRSAGLARGRDPSGPTSPLDTRARTPILTPAFFAASREDVTFAIKCAIAVELCFLVFLGLDWPG